MQYILNIAIPELYCDAGIIYLLLILFQLRYSYAGMSIFFVYHNLCNLTMKTSVFILFSANVMNLLLIRTVYRPLYISHLNPFITQASPLNISPQDLFFNSL